MQVGQRENLEGEAISARQAVVDNQEHYAVSLFMLVELFEICVLTYLEV